MLHKNNGAMQKQSSLLKMMPVPANGPEPAMGQYDEATLRLMTKLSDKSPIPFNHRVV